jgi:hypothetical protein
MIEKLFTNDEIEEIIIKALNNPGLNGSIVVDGNASEKSIITISSINGLIFVKGNIDTGFEHIRLRHSFFSLANFWKSQNGKLDNPSKFRPDFMPIIDYIKIADEIFKTENKNITKNNNPDSFDKYTGNYKHSDGKEEKYHLLVYKGTKLVHSLFPDKKKHNFEKDITKKLSYGKGIVTNSKRFPEGVNDLVVPYVNSSGMIVYSILLRKSLSDRIERIFIQKHDENGIANVSYLLTERPFDSFEFNITDTMLYQHSDLSFYEEIINQIDNN